MKKLATALVAAGILSGAWLGLAGTVSAQPLAGGSAADAVSSLEAKGYTVQINGDQSAPLSQCTVTDVSGLRGSDANGQPGVPAGSTVYVGVACDDDHDE